jgi:hypothetical protein
MSKPDLKVVKPQEDITIMIDPTNPKHIDAMMHIGRAMGARMLYNMMKEMSPLASIVLGPPAHAIHKFAWEEVYQIFPELEGGSWTFEQELPGFTTKKHPSDEDA